VDLTRRDFVKAAGALATAAGLQGAGLLGASQALGLPAELGGVPVIWLQGQACSGCSVSLLNSVHYATIDDLAVNTLDMKFHRTIMAGAGEPAVSAVEIAYDAGGYVLVVEGAIPADRRGVFCELWPDENALDAVRRFARRAAFVIAAGTCACYGGISGAAPNPTGARGLGTFFAGTPVINIPGCPVHPDWLVGVVAYLIANGQLPPLDGYGRPIDYFGTRIHSGRCPHRDAYNADIYASSLGEEGCLLHMGCRGRDTRADCGLRKWNADGPAGSADQYGVSWCIQAGSPCYGCTQPDFPDGTAPFYTVQAVPAAPVGRVDNATTGALDDAPAAPAPPAPGKKHAGTMASARRKRPSAPNTLERLRRSN